MLRERVKCRLCWVGGFLSGVPSCGQTVGSSDLDALAEWPLLFAALTCDDAIMSVSDSTDWSSCPTLGGFLCFIHGSPGELRGVRARNQSLAKAPTFKPAHHSFVCLFSWVAVCQNVAIFIFLPILFSFKSIASDLMAFALVSLAVQPLGGCDNLGTFFSAVRLFLSAQV